MFILGWFIVIVVMTTFIVHLHMQIRTEIGDICNEKYAVTLSFQTLLSSIHQLYTCICNYIHVYANMYDTAFMSLKQICLDQFILS